MLRDITSTSSQVNSLVIPSIRWSHSKSPQPKSDRKRVKFDTDGMEPPRARLMVAMAGEKRQKRKRKQAKLSGASTPKRRKLPELPVIGSGSTWKEEQLDMFKVQVVGDVDAKQMIPENWFEFGKLKNFQVGLLLPSTKLTESTG